MAQAINISTTEVIETVQNIFVVSYQGDELKRRVASILGLTEIYGWNVVDTYEDSEKGVHLALVHYNDDADMSLYGHLRGVLVDVVGGFVIAKSFGQTPTATSDTLSVVDGKCSVTDTEGFVHSFDLDDVTIKRAFDGVVIRVIRHKGETYYLTHRKIRPTRSRWGSSPPFLTMYSQGGGPTEDQLFDLSKENSTTCYVFLVCHPVLLVGSRQNVSHPYVVFLTKYEMNSEYENCAPGIDTFERIKTIKGIADSPFIHDPQPLSIEEANKHLKWGYYNEFDAQDDRMTTGESIIMYSMQDGEIFDIVRVNSPSCSWRSSLRGNNPNIVNQFYSMLNLVYKDVATPNNANANKAWDDLKNNFILFPLYEESSIKDLYNTNKGILTLPMEPVTKDMYATKESRFHLLWLNYVLALPTPVQSEALDILSNFKTDRQDLVTWLIDLESTKNINLDDYHRRIKSLLQSARAISRQRVKDKNNYSLNGAYMSLPTIIKSTIRNFVGKENGPSLYTLVREMKKDKTAKLAAANIESTA